MWAKFFLFIQLLHVISADDLIFIQAVWRHGDRLPTLTYPNDPLQEPQWIDLPDKGFQGFGQLTTKGMAQHFIMGQRLRSKYVNDTASPSGTNILSPVYKMHEIYIRSTDVNRTIISAMSNLIGMLNPGRDGLDYPSKSAWPNVSWPQSFIPIAVHTVNDNTDHLGNPDADCTRQTLLWKMVTQTDEYKNLSAVNQDFLQNISKICGTTINLDNLWTVHDSIFIKKDNNLTNATYIDPWLYANFGRITDLNNILEDWNNGLNLSLYPDPKINFAVELPRIRGGALLGDIIFHMKTKRDCYMNNTNDPKACTWINPLKYYVYSA
uniref:Uncharacterized protein n=1 Tax=Acrobeloides nanus TaxID=290746 RepID=A0A914EF15_9BILA